MNINTINTKEQQLNKGYFSTGTGNELIFILGSCRAVPYLSYLHKWNNQNGNRFTIAFIDPFNWHWDMAGNRVDFEECLRKAEANPRILEMLSKCNVFIHEYYSNAEMFNCDKTAEKNIYKFGMNPQMDITIPNFNDVFILMWDILLFDNNLKYKAIQDINVNGAISEQTLAEANEVKQKNLQKFYGVCKKTDFPEMEDIFENQFRHKRFFWNSNHVSKHFTLNVFKLLNDKFLKLPITEKYWNQISEEDLYANNYTYLCEYDKGYQWGEEIKKIKF